MKRVLKNFALIVLFGGPFLFLSACSSTSEGEASNEANANANANANAEAPKGEEEALDDFSFLDEGKGKNAAGDEANENQNGNGNLLANSNIENSADENFNEVGNDEENINNAPANIANNSNLGEENAASFNGEVASENFANDPTIPEGNLVVPGAEENPDFFANVGKETPMKEPEAVAEGSAAPVPVAEVSVPEGESSSVPVVDAKPVVAENKDDVEAVNSTVHWVGYHIDEKSRKLQIEMETKGNPEYQVFEENNRRNQAEIVFRFYQSKLRKKIHWDINSSEFRSPVAYIRMREFKDKGVVDVVLTHRDKIMPEFYEKDGKFLLSYTVPDRYFGNQEKAARVVKDRAVALGKPLLKEKPAVTGKLPVTGFTRVAFKEKPVLRPIRDVIANRETQVDKDGLPESFERGSKRTGLIWEHRNWVGVAQDDLEENFANEGEAEDDGGDENLGNNAENNAENNAANNANNLGNSNLSNANLGSNLGNANTGNESGNAANAKKNANAGGGNEFGNGSFDSENQNAFGEDDSGSNNTGNNANFIQPEENTANIPVENSSPSVDVEGQASTEAPQKFTGKPIFMDFYDSTLSLVLKSFQTETGNNFVYPAAVGNIPITISFKGVAWDEALKGILETHNLGMVRVGPNVVRIDQIANLTQYMVALEQAKAFESRRTPTRMMVFRMNNGVAPQVADRIRELLVRDTEIDPRIKVTADNRTNSIVVEAPNHVLTKVKVIMDRLDTETPQVEIASRIVEVQKSQSNFFGISWGNNFNFDPGRALGFGTLNFPNSIGSNFAVDPGVTAQATAGVSRFRIGSLNKFIDLDLLLKMEEKKGTTNVLQSNRVLVLDGQRASVVAGSSQFFRPAAGGNIINPAPGAPAGTGNQEAAGLSEVRFDLSLEVTPQVTALGAVLMNLNISSDTPGDVTGEALATKNTRNLQTQMVRNTGETGVIGGIYDTKRTQAITGVPLLSSIPILGALFRSTTTTESQTELLIMVTPTIVSGTNDRNSDLSMDLQEKPVISAKRETSNQKGTL